MSTSPGSEWQKLLQSYCDNIMLPPKKYGKLPLIPLSPPKSSSATLSPDQPDLGKGYSSRTYLVYLVLFCNPFVCSFRECLLPESHLWSHLSHLKKLKRRSCLIRFPVGGSPSPWARIQYTQCFRNRYCGIYCNTIHYNTRSTIQQGPKARSRESSSHCKNSTVSTKV